jgi:hypothetical protein
MNLNNLKFLGLNIKDYIVDIWFLILLGPLTNSFIQWLYFNVLHKNWPRLDIFPLSFDVVKLLAWIGLYLGIKWLWEDKVKTWYSKFNSFEFNSKKPLDDKDFIKNWIFQGNAQPFKGGLLVSNTNSGCLIKSGLWRLPFLGIDLFRLNNIWKNFTANVEIDFLGDIQNKKINPAPHTHDGALMCTNSHCTYPFKDSLGLIFRAQNFDDYFMLELLKINDNIVIRPHIRSSGNWDAPILNIDNNSVKCDFPLKITIQVVGSSLTLNIQDKKIQWLLPTHLDTNLIGQIKDKESVVKTIISEIYFRDRAGMFGFRCFGDQIALVKSLKVENYRSRK